MPTTLQLADHPVRTGQQTQPDGEPLELRSVEGAHLVAHRPLDGVAGDVGHQQVRTHPDGGVQHVGRYDEADVGERPRPRHGVLVHGVDERSVDVQNHACRAYDQRTHASCRACLRDRPGTTTACHNRDGARSASVSTSTSRTGSRTAAARRTQAQEIAARTVNKERARAGEARQASRTSTDDLSSSRRGGLRSHRGPGGRTKAQLYAEARKKNVKGRSSMTKAELERAVGRG